jgi:hypothetical protein
MSHGNKNYKKALDIRAFYRFVVLKCEHVLHSSAIFLFEFGGARLCEPQRVAFSKALKFIQTFLSGEAVAGHSPALR